jgi:hypothetical protein
VLFGDNAKQAHQLVEEDQEKLVGAIWEVFGI